MDSDGAPFGAAEEINLAPNQPDVRREEAAASSQEWKIEILTLPSPSLSLSVGEWALSSQLARPDRQTQKTQPRDLNARKARDYQGTYQSRHDRGDP